MGRKHQTRAELSAELTRRDRANRCAWCKVNLLTEPGPLIATLDGRRFCSEGCFQSEQQWIAYCEERRANK